jgi:hypothetical protein
MVLLSHQFCQYFYQAPINDLQEFKIIFLTLKYEYNTRINL